MSVQTLPLVLTCPQPYPARMTSVLSFESLKRVVSVNAILLPLKSYKYHGGGLM
jgi:hypothetical protein